MKITFVLPQADMSGGVRVVAIYADRMRNLGHTVKIVSTTPRRPALKRRLKHLLVHRNWEQFIGRRTSHLDELTIPHHVVPESRAITDDDVPDADVIIATWWETAEWIARLSPSKGAKAHLIQHHEIWGGEPQRVNATWKLPMHKIVISQWLRELASNFGDEAVSYIPNSVCTKQFHALPRDRSTPSTVGMLYSPVKFKGVDVSLRAWTRAAEDVGDLKLIAFGAEKPSSDFVMPRGTEFICNPPQDRIREIYARCDVWMCGSHSEGFHLPILEAMACRCPVVSTRVGGAVDAIENGLNGFLVDVEDSDSLGERVIEVLRQSPRRWRAMSDAALETAVRYSWDDATALFEQALYAARGLRGPATFTQRPRQEVTA